MAKGYWWALGGAGVLAVVAYTQLTLFVVQPMGAVPEGRTVLLWRRSEALRFVDSADAFCERQGGGVSLLCRGVTMGAVVQNNPVLLRLPYSEMLYSISTGGTRHDR